MRFSPERAIRLFALILAICTIAITALLIRHRKLGKSESLPTSPPATYVDTSLGIRVTLPQPWIVLSASEAAMVTSHGQAALAESGRDPNDLGIEHPNAKARLLTAMNPVTGDSFQILKQEGPPSTDESKPEMIANDLRSTFLNLLPMQPLGPVERVDVTKAVAHFNGILTVKGTPIYQSVFVTLVKNTAITFVFSGRADSLLGESKRSFPKWVSFDRSAVR
jgi:hypothetical protein